MVDRVALSPDEACGILLGDKCSQEYDPWKQQWNILIPGGKPPVKPIPFPKVSTFLHRLCPVTLHWCGCGLAICTGRYRNAMHSLEVRKSRNFYICHLEHCKLEAILAPRLHTCILLHRISSVPFTDNVPNYAWVGVKLAAHV